MPISDVFSNFPQATVQHSPAMASTLARIAAQVHITANPSPRNIAESRQILSALQKFGEVITYRNLKYDTSNTSTLSNRPIVAIFETADAANRAIASSPITISLPTPPHSKPNTPSPSEPHSITFEIQESRHNHASALKRSPFYSTYNLFKNNPIYEDLISDETGIPLKELADTLASKKYNIGPGVKINIQEDNRRMGAASLVNMWNEGMCIDEETPPKGERIVFESLERLQTRSRMECLELALWFQSFGLSIDAQRGLFVMPSICLGG
ncbi:uncharacterized protein N7506_009659 [Penicillium brevicompactum]|uniref:uncharacterized protein n=1 Tax=Penicillium brevicompactum TaxID=5074 RepID=UPI002540DC55|nr:uncharacterized protein N7506_009659 [Penicillium brevicompactum]KAJ5326557.1 hypothetical protein N7506_009659 [Penicillium brevicompactum]